MVMKYWNVIYSVVIIHAATISVNVSKKSILCSLIIDCIIICGHLMMGFQEDLRIFRPRPQGIPFRKMYLHVWPVRSVF